MGAEREARSLKARAEAIAEADAEVGREPTDEMRANLETYLAEFVALPRDDHSEYVRAYDAFEARWVGIPRQSIESALDELAKAERSAPGKDLGLYATLHEVELDPAPAGPEPKESHGATLCDPDPASGVHTAADRFATGQPGAERPVVEPPASDVTVLPTGNKPKPGRAREPLPLYMPPAWQWPSVGGGLFVGDPKAPTDVFGNPLPPRPRPQEPDV